MCIRDSHCVGAIINGAVAPLTHELSMGDRVEILSLIHIFAQGVEVLDRAGDANGAGMAPEANEQVGALLHRLEQVDATRCV